MQKQGCQLTGFLISRSAASFASDRSYKMASKCK